MVVEANLEQALDPLLDFRRDWDTTMLEPFWFHVVGTKPRSLCAAASQAPETRMTVSHQPSLMSTKLTISLLRPSMQWRNDCSPWSLSSHKGWRNLWPYENQEQTDQMALKPKMTCQPLAINYEGATLKWRRRSLTKLDKENFNPKANIWGLSYTPPALGATV